MAESNEQWELSKENIQPIQQGRKQKVLKVALAAHPEDLILQQRQTFEYELRTYSGDDPLSVWCRYIKWVEQNFPKGGREGHIKQLVEQCFTILKDEKKYYDDNRFIDILLKMANINSKPLDVYNYMYSNNIGCKSAKFFINWSWELEQLGSFKKAEEVLTEGIQRRAEPFDNIRSYQNEFDMRFAKKIKEESEANNFEPECGRSAFAMLKPLKKKVAPISRVGEAVVDNKRAPLILSKQQAQPKSVSAQVKVPFKIYNSENITPSLPVQSRSNAQSILHSEIYKENEQTASKWNKVKVKPHSQSLRTPTEVTPSFKFHCDDESDQQICIPKSGTKSSNVLCIRTRTPSPVMALFEPPDPMKKTMYPKKKVYGGVGEYSLEEIRAAEWFEKEKKMKQELLLTEQQKKIEEQIEKEKELEKKIESLTKQVELLQTNFAYPVPKSLGSSSIGMNYSFDSSDNFKNKSKLIPEYRENTVRSVQSFSPNISIKELRDISENVLSYQNNFQKVGHNLVDTFENKCFDSKSYQEADKMVQELYNKTLSHSVYDIENKTSEFNLDIDKKCIPTSSSNICFQDLSKSNKHEVPKPDFEKTNINFPFVFYHDPTEIISDSNNVNSKNVIEKVIENNCSTQKTSKLGNEDSDDDDENIPPKGYVQERKNRELVGVLEPSKNVLFIPLDQQVQDDSDTEDALICQPGNQHANETLIPPSNTEQFSTALFLSSTPCVNRKDKKTNLVDSKYENVPKPVNNACEEACPIIKNKPISFIAESVNMEHTVSKTDIKSIKETHVQPGLPNVLSVIMEASYENYSKSSSSSSSSVNLTKSSHLDPSSSHFGSVRKPYSKLETYEKCSLTSVSEVSDSISKIKACEVRIPHKIQPKPDQNKQIKLFTVDFDPFEPQLNREFLKSVDSDNLEILHKVPKSLRSVKIGETVCINNIRYRIESLIAEGTYAKVYEAVESLGFISRYNNKQLALKVCKNGNEWEFYICQELQKRLRNFDSLPNIQNSVMNIIFALKYLDGIILVNEYSAMGTLLDVVNFYKKQNSAIPEFLAMYLTIEILHIVSRLHELNIIHGDIKPDNFLITNNAFQHDILEHLSDSTMSLRLIDFGRAIDLNCYDKGICFMNTRSTTNFKCNEMKDNKPWVFQLDWYCVLSCIHTMLFTEYMTVKKNNNMWEIEKKFKRYWHVSLWKPLFAELLNIPECYKEPDIKPYIDMIKSTLQQNSKHFIEQLSRLTFSYPGKK